jgi:predicted cupin superfamily sugar epimerase
MKDAEFWIRRLGLQPHPEGWSFAEMYRSPETISGEFLPARYGSSRNVSTAIYFLLRGTEISHLHRIRSDEIWHFYAGTRIIIHAIGPDGTYERRVLGGDAEVGTAFMTVIEREWWFGAEVEDTSSFALVGCTVAPGFDFADFEMAKRDELVKKYPQHREMIVRLTRG